MLGACAIHLLVGSWQKMASAKFLEEALSTDVDESEMNAIVGSLETQLVTASPGAGTQVNAATAVNTNHVNSAISNGGTGVPPSSTQKHGVSNGGAGESVNILLNNADPAKSSLTPSMSHQPVSTNVVNTVVGAVPASGYINQIQTTASVTPSVVATSTNPSNLTPLTNKHHEPVKILYPNNQTLTSSGGVVNLNSSRVTFPAGTLPNGNVNLVNATAVTPSTLQSHHPHQTVLNAVTSSVQSVVSHSILNSNVNALNKQQGVIGNSSGNSRNMVEAGNIKQAQMTHTHQQQQGPALVHIKTNNPSGTVVTSSQQHTIHGGQQLTGMVTVPITTMTTLSGVTHSGSTGVVTLAKNIAGSTTQAVVGSHQPGTTTLLPANVQILNVNAVRPSGPGGPGQKTLPQRVVIGAPHMVGARPGQAGQITLQALQGLQPGTSGHLLLKTENGQYQLLRVGAAPTTPAAAAITPTGSPATATTGMPTTTYRLQSVPASAAPRAPTPMQQHTVVTAGSTTTTAQAAVAQPSMAAAAQAAAVAQLQLQRQAVDSTKEKCRKFLANLLELSSREPKQVEKNVRTLIQELIDTKVEPEEFCDRLERLLNASPQPCLIGFLKKSLPLLRQALITKELVIDGIRPPPQTVVFSLAPGSMMVPQLQARGANLQQGHIRLSGQQMGTTQVRVMSPMMGAGSTGGAAGGQVMGGMARTPHTTVQHRLVTVSAAAANAAVAAARTTKLTALSPPAPYLYPPYPPPLPSPYYASEPVRPHLNAQSKIVTQIVTSAATCVASTPTTTHSPMTMVTVRHQAPVVSTPAVPKPAPAPKEAKEKKTFSSSGYTGDDDINDVAAMGGVNLAEESQRILGSTEFVGTQIRSVKDEMFLHSGPLQLKIKQIMMKHGLDDTATSDVTALVSHATQERLKSLVEKLAVIAEHRIDMVKAESRYEVVQDVKAQLRFLEDLDRMERRRHEEQERELLLRAAKSRSKSEDPEQAKLKAKAKEMQRAEMEELRQREANLTALQAIGPRKKPKLDLNGTPGTSGQSSSAGPSSGSTSTSRSTMPLRPRVKRVNLRDLIFLLEQERESCRTPFLYKAFLK